MEALLDLKKKLEVQENLQKVIKLHKIKQCLHKTFLKGIWGGEV